MPDRHDDDLPHDLRDTARLLGEQRAQATGPELDALWRRARRQAGAAGAARGGRARALVAALLTTGIIGASGVTAVLAATSAGGGATTLSRDESHKRDTAACQYDDDYLQGSYTGTQTKGESSATITVTYHCGSGDVCIEASKDISNYAFDTGESFEGRMREDVCVAVPAGATSIRVKSGTTTYTFTFPAV